MLILLLAASGTALATGLGAIPVYLLGRRAREWQPALYGLAAGVMGVASIIGLLKPALDEGGTPAVAIGFAAGVGFLVAAMLLLNRSDVHVGKLRGATVRTSVLVFAVLFVHSIPEGFAVGTAYASETAGLSLFVILAIAIQNVPEGTSVAVPMDEAGFSPRQQFWAAVMTSAPQPAGALVAYAMVETIESLLPISFAFAAGAMLALIAADLGPRALSPFGWRGPLGIALGAAVMVALGVLLGV